MNPQIATGQTWRRRSSGRLIKIGNDLSSRGYWSDFVVTNDQKRSSVMSQVTLYRHYELVEEAAQ